MEPPREDQITSQQAAMPLVARASFEPSQVPGPILAPACSAGGICPLWHGSVPGSAATRHTWGLTFTEALHWQFSDAAGVIDADVTIPTDTIISVLLADDATGWQVARFNVFIGNMLDPVCRAGVAMLDFRLSGDVTTLRDQGVEGCELHAQVNRVDEGRYIWRFGVLLAADALAHASQPGIPVAPVAEVAAVGG